MPILASPLRSLAVIGRYPERFNFVICFLNADAISRVRFVRCPVLLYYTKERRCAPSLWYVQESGRVCPILTEWFVAPIVDFFDRFRSRPNVGSGWQAVATEEVELAPSPR